MSYFFDKRESILRTNNEMLKVNAHMAIKVIAMLLLQFFVLNCFAAQIHQKDLSTLNAQAEKLVNSSPDKAILILKEVLKEMDASGDRQLKAKVLKNLGNAQYHLANYRQSLEYYEQALKIYRELEDQEGIASMLNNSGLL
ncbi:MAG: tetratricopeptide repeat protein, partial [Lentimicrobiaceae bacterium]